MKWKNCLVSSTGAEMHQWFKKSLDPVWMICWCKTDAQTDQSQESFPSSVNLNIVCISWSITIDQPCGTNLHGFAGEQPDQPGHGCQTDSPVTAIKHQQLKRFLRPTAPSLNLILDSEGTVLLHLPKVPQTILWRRTERNYQTRWSAQLWLNRKEKKLHLFDNQLLFCDKCHLKTLWKFPRCLAILLQRCRVLKDMLCLHIFKHPARCYMCLFVHFITKMALIPHQHFYVIVVTLTAVFHKP